MIVLAANPSGAVMTFVFPVTLFACVVGWAFFQFSRR